MTWPTTLLLGNMTTVSDGFILMHLARKLTELGIVADEREFAMNWMGETQWYFETPKEFMCIDANMLDRLELTVGLQHVLCDGGFREAKTVKGCSQSAKRLHEIQLLHELLDRVRQRLH